MNFYECYRTMVLLSRARICQAVCEVVAADKLLEPIYKSPIGPISPLDVLYGHRFRQSRPVTITWHTNVDSPFQC